ncbi:MAG: hypothetical protein RJA38_260 [Bacteroidota bacterium]
MRTHLRKMRTTLSPEGKATYVLPLFDNLDGQGELNMNDLVGRKINILATGDIRCILHGEKLNKTFGEGLCWNGFQDSSNASPCIIHPELCRAHEGVALRGDMEWEKNNHLIPHVVYLSYTSGIKVGVTSERNLHSRWIDQGARKGVVFARVPYRQLAGEFEVMLKEYVSDKSNWKGMLQPQFAEEVDLLEAKDKLLFEVPDAYQDFIDDEDKVWKIDFPCDERPVNPKAWKLSANNIYEGKLKGIVGQYLILENQHVFNIRSHVGHEIEINVLD